MTPLAFYWSRWRGDDAALAQLSAPQSALMRDLAGRRVALVGNARSLGDASFGRAIDAHDLVIRLNSAPMATAASHGQRTDWLAISVAVSAERVAERAPKRVIWVTPKRRRLPRHIAQSDGFYLMPAALQSELAATLASRPTTGAMMIAFLLASDAATITLYGFDFFASLSTSGSRSAEQTPHNHGAEARWYADRAAADPRLTRA